jgi:hypothetical protein
VVSDHGEEPVSPTVRDRIHPDPEDLLQAGIVEWSATTRVTMLATASQEQRSNRVIAVHPLGEPSDDVLEVTDEPGARPGPGHLLRADPATPAATQTADLSGRNTLLAPRSSPRQDRVERS